MAATTALLIGSAIAGGIGAIKNSQAQREQADYQANQDSFNATVTDLQAADAIARGETDAQNAGIQAAQLKGTQKAAFAGQGVDVSTGSAADLIAETDKMSMLDILTIKNNAAKEAFGYKAQGAGYLNQADITKKAGKSAANTTLLTGGANVLSAGANIYGSATKNDKSSITNNYYGGAKP